MSKRYRLKKDLPDVKAGANVISYDGDTIFHIPNPNGGTMYRFSDEKIASLPDWFEEIVEPERIEVKNLSIAPFNNPVDYSAHWYNFGTTGQVQQEKFSAIKEAIEGVLNPKPEASHTPAPERDWEILECYTADINVTHNYWNGKDGSPPCETVGCNIKSVRRLSDNEVFTVGDEFRVDSTKSSEGCFKIKSFYISSTEKVMRVSADSLDCYFSSLKKLPPKPQPLFESIKMKESDLICPPHKLIINGFEYTQSKQS